MNVPPRPIPPPISFHEHKKQVLESMFYAIVPPNEIVKPKTFFNDDGPMFYVGESKTQKDGTCKTCGAPRKEFEKCQYCNS